MYTKALSVADDSRINGSGGGDGYLPWLSGGLRLSGQGVHVLAPSLPPF